MPDSGRVLMNELLHADFQHSFELMVLEVQERWPVLFSIVLVYLVTDLFHSSHSLIKVPLHLLKQNLSINMHHSSKLTLFDLNEQNLNQYHW